jgi:hypothetical protein
MFIVFVTRLSVSAGLWAAIAQRWKIIFVWQDPKAVLDALAVRYSSGGAAEETGFWELS